MYRFYEWLDYLLHKANRYVRVPNKIQGWACEKVDAPYQL